MPPAQRGFKIYKHSILVKQNTTEGTTHVGNHKNSIELNGKIYDVSTGRPVSIVNHQPQTKKITHASPQKPSKKGLTIDGFIRPPAASRKPVRAQQPKNKASIKHVPPRKISSPNNIEAHLQKSKTLMRGAVKKPARTEPEEQNLKTKHERERLQRAQQIKKSSRIKRFISPMSSNYKLETKKSNLIKNAKSNASQQARETSHDNYLSAISLSSAKIVKPVSPHAKSEEAIANAMRSAQSHETNPLLLKKPKHRLARRLGFSRKATNVALTSLTIVLLGGFILYQNIPNLSMRIASSRAGFSANMPGYKPSGFSMSGPVEYGPGKVRVSFNSNSDERQFSLTQQVSNWNSSALADNYMLANNKQYQTFDDNGKTIYIYDSSNATWVSGGVWYQIEGDSSLTSDQLLKIASSI